MGPCQDKRGSAEVGMHGGVGGAVSGDDDLIDEPDGEKGGNDGVGWMGQVISIYPYVPPHVFSRYQSALPGIIEQTGNKAKKYQIL